MDCGVGFRESSIRLNSPVTRYCTHKVTQIVGSSVVAKDQTIVVCRVQVGNPPIDCFTILNGIDNLSTPLLGRFILHDSTIRTYVGALVSPGQV